MAAVDFMLQIVDMIKFILVWFWWLILLIWIFAMKMRLKNWPIEAIIIEKRGANLIKTNDRSGRYTDPYTGITGYKLQKAKDTIPVVGYDWVMHCVAVNTTFFDRIINLLRGNLGTIFLFRYGSKQYKPIRINEKTGAVLEYQEIKNEKGESCVIQVYQPFDPRDKLGALDFEVVDWDNMNFMVQEQRASIMRRQKQSDWIKTIAVPLAIIGAAVIFCIIMMKFGYDYSLALKGTAPAATTAETTPPKVPIIGDLVTPG